MDKGIKKALLTGIEELIMKPEMRGRDFYSLNHAILTKIADITASSHPKLLMMKNRDHSRRKIVTVDKIQKTVEIPRAAGCRSSILSPGVFRSFRAR